jgi:hypothetical protein
VITRAPSALILITELTGTTCPAGPDLGALSTTRANFDSGPLDTGNRSHGLAAGVAPERFEALPTSPPGVGCALLHASKTDPTATAATRRVFDILDPGPV